ncbi:MAG TPA: transposase [Gammaproteobacteria bacterium]|nr:transposase [Gammaproteobacteria bacterium]
MPRRPRLFLPDQPQHVVVRGHNRDPVLVRDDDFRYLYRCLREAANKNRLAIHAWVFMHNHLHLLATPGHEASLSKTMQSVGRRYAHYFNRTYHRSGSLWEGRYKCSLVDTDRYLLECYRYIELNPVRAGIVKQPADYPYSSYHANALGRQDSMVTPHAVFTNFISGVEVEKNRPRHLSEADVDTNREAYRQLCDQSLHQKTLTEIRRGTEKGLGIGRAEFLLKVAQLYP